MITRDREQRFWAYLLVIGGSVLLAANLGWFGWLGSWFWALLFLAGGGAFLNHYRANREHWWALIPGAALAAVGVTILAGDAGGPLFLAILGAGFATVYATGRHRWWAVIPAGVLLTLAAVAWIDEGGSGLETGWLFFLGLAVTFGYLYLLPAGRGKQPWAVFPAVATLALAAVTFLGSGFGGIAGPLALIAVGAYLIWRRRGPRNDHPLPPKEA